MSGVRLSIILSIICLVSWSVGCRYYVGGISPDATSSDAIIDEDARDDDPDAEPVTDAGEVDAAPPDAAVTECGQVSGHCTANLNAICPTGTQPYLDDLSLDCGGHCCVPNAASTCNANPDTNCSMMPACTGCWAPPTNTTLECDGGRPCCEWVCD